MRISTTMMYKSYGKTLDEKYSQIRKYSDQANSQRKFERGSDDPVGAMKTLKTCHEYTMNMQYMSNQQQASTFLSTTETYVKQINSVLQTASEKASEAVNGDKNEADLLNYATGMENYRDELMTSLNSIYTGRYVFGGSSSAEKPFRLDADNKLQVYDYGKRLPGKADADGYIKVSDLTEADVKELDKSLVSQIDLGTGTSFDMRTSALQTIITGYGAEGDKSINIVDRVTAAIDAHSHEGFSTLMGDIKSAQDSITRVEVNIGERSNKLSQVSTALINNKTNLTQAMADSYEADQIEAITNYNMAQMIYNESLSMAQTVLQNSIIDFLK